MFVRDTKFEKQQHDATPRHQSNIQRSLKNIHKEKEREERDSARAKAEVARLNGIVSGNAGPSAAKASFTRNVPAAPPPPPVRSAQEDRMRQAEQLAAMGGVIPQEFRRDMAMAGQWQTISTTPLQTAVKQDPDGKTEDDPDAKAVGVRKRKVGEVEEEEANVDNSIGKKKVWGKTLKTFPGANLGGTDDDLDALLGGVGVTRSIEDANSEGGSKAKGTKDALNNAIEQRIPDVNRDDNRELLQDAIEKRIPEVKREDTDQDATTTVKADPDAQDEVIKTEDEIKSEVKLESMPIFKKRRPKAAQQT